MRIRLGGSGWVLDNRRLSAEKNGSAMPQAIAIKQQQKGRARTSDLRIMSVISSKSETFVKSVTYGHRAVYDDAPTGIKSTIFAMFFNP